MAVQFEIKKNEGGQFTFRLLASNGQIILTSQRYRAKANAQAGIASVKKHASDDARFERRTSAGNQPYFVLKAINGRIIGQSEMYSSAAALEKGIASVKTNAAAAPIVDLAV